MSLVKDPKYNNGYQWQYKRSCRKQQSIRTKIFFEGSKLTIKQIIFLVYFWAYKTTSEKWLKHECKIGSSNTIVDLKNFCRDVMAEYFLNNPQVLGEPGCIVEIDNSVCFCFQKIKCRAHC